MATKFDEKLIKEIVGSPHNYWLTVKASKDIKVEIDIYVSPPKDRKCPLAVSPVAIYDKVMSALYGKRFVIDKIGWTYESSVVKRETTGEEAIEVRVTRI